MAGRVTLVSTQPQWRSTGHTRTAGCLGNASGSHEINQWVAAQPCKSLILRWLVARVENRKPNTERGARLGEGLLPLSGGSGITQLFVERMNVWNSKSKSFTAHQGQGQTTPQVGNTGVPRRIGRTGLDYYN